MWVWPAPLCAALAGSGCEWNCVLDCAAEVSARQQGGVYKARLCRRRVTVNGGARKHTYLPRSSGALKKIWSMPPRVTARHAVTVARGTQLRPCARCFGRLAALVLSLRIGEGAGEARGITVHPEDVLAVSGPACTLPLLAATKPCRPIPPCVCIQARGCRVVQAISSALQRHAVRSTVRHLQREARRRIDACAPASVVCAANTHTASYL